MSVGEYGMLEVYAEEFVGISSYLNHLTPAKKGFILVEKVRLVELLDKNKYDTAANKLRIWKALKWIDTDADRRLTKRVYDGESGTYKPYIKMDAAIWEQLKVLIKA